VRTVFFGTPAIAVPALEALAGCSDVCGVVCQPDRPKGRGMKLSSPEVKQVAERLGLPVYQPLKVRTGELESWLSALHADVAVVLAYGRILPVEVLNAPKRGCMNLHASLLPHYRGAAPINWALINGESETGMSLMQMDVGLDTGPVYTMRKLPITASTDADSLSEQMAALAALIVKEDLPRAVRGELTATPQDEAHATFAPPLKAEHLALRCAQPARQVVNQIRGLSSKPGARAAVSGKLLKILRAEVAEEQSSGEAGRVVLADKNGILVQANPGSFKILFAQPEGKKVMPAADLVNGRLISAGQLIEPWQSTAP